ncbi:hypothetical protein [Deinococcus lacus]|uniref:hypothetical protein n=1 Tax=Deinococcus lacus TaxID=392561 RepID=UPI0036D2BE12
MAFRYAAPLILLAGSTLAGAQDLSFDVSGLQGQVMTILGVGVAIAIAFALFKVGKRATSRM